MIPRPLEDAADPAEALAERLAAEMDDDWRRQERPQPRAEDYLVRDRALCLNPNAALRIIYEEVCLREEAGQEVPLDELRRRFPRWHAELEKLLGYHGLMKTAAPARPVRFPEAGEPLGDFRLLAELGRGANGRVFLATQSSLADRPVVLKVIPAREQDQEHLTLARLQHTHIIPINGTQDFAELSLRTLCMPYYGGATLAALLEALGPHEPGRRTGAQLVEALDRARVELPSTPALAPRGPARQFLVRASFAQAVCWIGACLADALQYAHERGLLHLDLKPSNVLLTADGQPMLLDFHLACEPIRPEGPAPGRIGGTPGLMSPEQERAIDAVRAGRPIPAPVDGRSDLYSLGLMLDQALGGRVSRPPGRRARRNPQVSEGLAAILGKCLHPDPEARYASAAALAVDLRRHLADRPLKGVANPSLRERWRKLRRRQPHAPAVAGMVLAVTLAMLTVGANTAAHLVQRHREARLALAEGREALTARRAAEAVRLLSRGLGIAEGVPGARPLARDLARHLRRARRAVLADRLHAVADSVRFAYGAEHLARPTLRAIRGRCLAVWQVRDRLLARAEAELEPDLERRIATDLAELVVLLGDLGVRLAPAGDGEAARRAAHEEALRMLDEAAAILAPGPLLDRERQVHARALGLSAVARAAGRRAAEDASRTAWENETLGLSLLRAGDYEAAAAEFARALQSRPQDFWPNFYAGRCAFRLGRLDEAEQAFRICVALAPESPECAFNLGRVRQARGQTEQALADYDRALRLNPSSAEARLNRGLLLLGRDRRDDARADLRQARTLGADPAVVSYNLALIDLADGDPSAARAELRQALRLDPRHHDARTLLDRLHASLDHQGAR